MGLCALTYLFEKGDSNHIITCLCVCTRLWKCILWKCWMYSHAPCTYTSTHVPITSLLAPHPLPLTLPHTHKIWLNYPGVLSPACLLILLFLQRGKLIFSFCCAPLAYHRFEAFTPLFCLQVFLSFFSPLFLFTRLFYTVKDCVFWQGLAL